MEVRDFDRGDLTETPERVVERLVLRVDPGERGSVLFDLAGRCPLFDVRVEKLHAGDYGIGDEILIERKSYPDLEVSVVDGRLFRQAARLAHEAARGLILVEGPRPAHPHVHPHAIAGAILSLAVDWRLPVVFTDGPDESLVLLRLIAEHHIQPPSPFVARHESKPKRLTSRRLHVLEGLPGVGPALARRLLSRFATVEEVMMAEEDELTSVPGIGARKTAVIRKSAVNRWTLGGSWLDSTAAQPGARGSGGRTPRARFGRRSAREDGSRTTSVDVRRSRPSRQNCPGEPS